MTAGQGEDPLQMMGLPRRDAYWKQGDPGSVIRSSRPLDFKPHYSIGASNPGTSLTQELSICCRGELGVFDRMFQEIFNTGESNRAIRERSSGKRRTHSPSDENRTNGHCGF